jgi:hypothetical protein
MSASLIQRMENTKIQIKELYDQLHTKDDKTSKNIYSKHNQENSELNSKLLTEHN